jgi:hypothetical protein
MNVTSISIGVVWIITRNVERQIETISDTLSLCNSMAFLVAIIVLLSKFG